MNTDWVIITIMLSDSCDLFDWWENTQKNCTDNCAYFFIIIIIIISFPHEQMVPKIAYDHFKCEFVN